MVRSRLTSLPGTPLVTGTWFMGLRVKVLLTCSKHQSRDLNKFLLDVKKNLTK